MAYLVGGIGLSKGHSFCHGEMMVVVMDQYLEKAILASSFRQYGTNNNVMLSHVMYTPKSDRRPRNKEDVVAVERQGLSFQNNDSDEQEEWLRVRFQLKKRINGGRKVMPTMVRSSIVRSSKRYAPSQV